MSSIFTDSLDVQPFVVQSLILVYGLGAARMSLAHPFDLTGKVALVTGASRGIGAAIARALHQSGARVGLLGRDHEALAALAAELDPLGHTARSATSDIREPAETGRAIEALATALGGLHVFVNNAGTEELCPSATVTEALWDRIVDTNLKAAFFCAQTAYHLMADGGSILNVCSLTSEVGVPGAAAYGASKSGLAGLTRTLATEWAPRGIRVNGIGPGYFRTALTESFYADAAWSEAMLAKIPLRRFGQLPDLGGAAVFLASDASAYVTGQILYVDGGYLAAI